MPEVSEDQKMRHVVNAVDARMQASEDGYGFLRSEFRRAAPSTANPEGEIFEIPHKDLFDIGQQERWDDLQDALRDYDREDDVLAPNGALIKKGDLIYPHHKDGKRVKPSWPERLAIVLWGEDGAARAKAGGINLNEIELIWAKQRIALEERMKRDPKS